MDIATLGTAFGLIFISELGDKTQLAVIGLSARSSVRWAIVLGAAAAFIVLTLAASVIGALVGDALPTRLISVIAGVVFIVIGGLILRSVLHRKGYEDYQNGNGPVSASGGFPWVRAALSTFSLIFVAELGDKSQIAVTTLAARTQDTVSAFVGASLALVLLTVLSVLGGAILSRYIKPHVVEMAAGVLFVGIGVFLVVDGVFLA